MTKQCPKCKQTLDLDQFSKGGCKDGKASWCKPCAVLAAIEWKRNNPDKIKMARTKNKDKKKEQDRLYYLKNRDKLIAKACAAAKANPEKAAERNRKSSRKHRKKRSQGTRAWQKMKMATDVQFKLLTNLRCRLRQILKNQPKVGSSVRDLGCSGPELKKHFESLWTEGMSWDNYGNKAGQWSMDHIMPLMAFDLTNRQHFLLAFHYLNLQPMWHSENVRKYNKQPQHHVLK